MRIKNSALKTFFLLLAIQALPASLQSAAQAANSDVVTIYFVRHGEIERTTGSASLNERGLERATDIATTLERVNLTHVFSSHTLRSRQAVEQAARSHELAVVELPRLGSMFDGQEIQNLTPAVFAVQPLSEALKDLPIGSTALVGVNSDNVFAIMHNLGVQLGDSSNPCELGSNCVPCLRNTCFPAEFDNLWILRLNGQQGKTELTWLRYGSQKKG